jgi:hypothetical protein
MSFCPYWRLCHILDVLGLNKDATVKLVLPDTNQVKLAFFTNIRHSVGDDISDSSNIVEVTVYSRP